VATAVEQPTGDIRPFSVAIPREALDDLGRRLDATRWPSGEIVGDRSQGAQLAAAQEVCRYWANEYDLGRVEARQNALPQFTTEIDGVEIHFVQPVTAICGTGSSPVNGPVESLSKQVRHGRLPSVSTPTTSKTPSAARRLSQRGVVERCPLCGLCALRRTCL
jgi:hypothetical protein